MICLAALQDCSCLQVEQSLVGETMTMSVSITSDQVKALTTLLTVDLATLYSFASIPKVNCLSPQYLWYMTLATLGESFWLTSVSFAKVSTIAQSLVTGMT